MTPAAAIAMLDRQIGQHGQDVLLRKQGGTSADDKLIRANVRDYRPNELSGGIQQGDTNVVFSPTGLAASGFDGPPQRLTGITIAGRFRVIEVANPVQIGNDIVRWDLQVRG